MDQEEKSLFDESEAGENTSSTSKQSPQRDRDAIESTEAVEAPPRPEQPPVEPGRAPEEPETEPRKEPDKPPEEPDRDEPAYDPEDGGQREEQSSRAEEVLGRYLPEDILEADTSDIGYIEGSEPATSSTFYAVQAESMEKVVQLDDLLVAYQKLPDGRDLYQYGLVVEAESRLDGAERSSDTVAAATPGVMATSPTRRVKAEILRCSPDIGVAPDPGGLVSHVSEGQRQQALFRDEMERPLPVGLDQSNRPLFLDLAYLDGEKGGHLSISGISGVATKTSYAMFVLYMLLESDIGADLQAIRGVAAADSRALVFNVKGEDLMHLDRPNRKFDREAHKSWQALGVTDPGSFTGVKLYAPPKGSSGGQDSGGSAEMMADVETRDKRDVTAYGFTPLDFVAEGLLEYLLHLPPDTPMSMLEEHVRLKLMQAAHPLKLSNGKTDTEGAIVLASTEGKPDDPEFINVRSQRPKTVQDGEPIYDYRDLIKYVIGAMREYPEWAGGYDQKTVEALIRRLYGQKERGGKLVRKSVSRIDVEQAKVSVVDIHKLHADAQRFVVGVCLRDVYAQKEKGDSRALRVVVLDEMNKYAPKNGDSPIKDTLSEIATMGRSRGVILFGAQQETKAVEEKVVQQASVKASGRLDANEAREHQYLTPEMRSRATRFKPGRMVLHQPLIPEAMPIHFPFPAFAANSSEVGTAAGGAGVSSTLPEKDNTGSGGDTSESKPGRPSGFDI